MNQKIDMKTQIAVGFTVFASFFGAGNLIFPPYLGLTSGKSWIWAFLAYILMDAGLGAITILAVSRNKNGFQGIMSNLGKFGSILIFLDALCLGPLPCVPRTAAVTFELAVHPMFPNISSWIITFLYFTLVAMLCIRPSRIVDIIGTIMTPVLLVGLLILITKGFFTPAGSFGKDAGFASAFKDGLIAGYQTMDMLVASLLSCILIAGVADKHYTQKTTEKLFARAGLIATVGLFIVYGGLTYLGAVSEMDFGLSNAEILLGIINNIMGNGGLILLAIIVSMACLTTAIGLISACAKAVCDLISDKISYKLMVVIMSLISFVVSNLGIDTILKIASPILDLIYPATIAVVIISFLPKSIANKYTYCWAAGCAEIITIYCLIDSLTKVNLHSSALPLSNINLSWLIPSIVCGFIGYKISLDEKYMKK